MCEPWIIKTLNNEQVKKETAYNIQIIVITELVNITKPFYDELCVY